MRGDFIRLSVALVAGLMLSACGGAPVEEGPLPVETVESEDSHTASYIPRCPNTRAWIIKYYDESSPPQEVGRRECTCYSSTIYSSGITSGDSQLYYEEYCSR
ncbi:MAG TPA: hypothetical protein VE153_19035 [Myxococcus sp.]|jgi:hypothetical protein|nr:hypothetical protein [Myxococcus sp.]